MSPTILLGLLLAAGSAVATNVANVLKHPRANAVPGTGRGRAVPILRPGARAARRAVISRSCWVVMLGLPRVGPTPAFARGRAPAATVARAGTVAQATPTPRTRSHPCLTCRP